MKIVKESLNEKFSEKSDPVHDMNIGEPQPESEDITKIQNIYNIKDIWRQHSAARKMAKLIKDPSKAYRRYLAAQELGNDWAIQVIFLRRACELGSIWAKKAYRRTFGKPYGDHFYGHSGGVVKF